MKNKAAKAVLASMFLSLFLHSPAQAGIVLRVFYDEISGTAVEDLVNAGHFPSGPNPTIGPLFVELLTENLDTGPDLDAAIEDFGTHVRAFVQAPEDGDYTFFIASDDASELWLSSDHTVGNTNLVAFETGCCTALFSGDRLEDRSSDPVTLARGNWYYFEIRHKEGGGDEFIRMGWEKPDGTREVIPLVHVQPFPLVEDTGNLRPDEDVAPRILSTYFGEPVPDGGHPVSTNVVENEPVRFTVTALASQPASYQWKRDGTDIDGANLSSLLIPNASLDDAGDYTVVISNEFGEVESSAATLDVQPDTTAPTLVKADPQDTNPNRVTVVYSEPIDETTATDPANYSVNNDVTVDSTAAGPDNRSVILSTTGITDGVTDYQLTVNNVEDLAGNAIDADSQVPIQIFPVPQQGGGPENFVVVEAEAFTALTPQGEHNWEPHDGPPDFSGTGSLYALPDDPVAVLGPPEVFTLSPRLDYKIEFTSTGTHYIWFRGSDGGGNSLHVGLNGDLPATGNNINGGCCGDRATGGTDWVWVNELNDAVDGDNRARLEIDSTGLHTLNVWMREDGQIIDKLVLTTDPNFVPSGQGPEASSTIDFAHEDARIEFTEQPAGVTVQERQTATFSAVAEAFSGDQALPEEEILYQWQRDGEDIPGATGTSYTTGELGVDDDGALFTVQARVPGARATSQEALLTVEGDDDPPELLSRARGRSTLDWVTLFFSERLDPDSATATDNYAISSDGGDLAVTQASLSADGTQVFLGTDPQTVGTRYTVTVNNVTDIAAAPNPIAPDSEAFFFGQGTPNQTEDGLVVIEAENYTANTPQGDHTWELQEGPDGLSGIGTMYALPASGNIGPVDAPNSSPQLDFTINFSQTGTHYLWFRGSDGGGNSIHAGLNGAVPPTLERIDGGCCGTRADGGQDLVWVGNINGDVNGDSRARFDIPSAGEHTLNIWMREGGIIVDKIIVTTDPSFTPSGMGPEETPREGTPVPPTVELTAPAEGEQFPAGGPVTLEVSVSGEQPIQRVEFFENSNKIGEATTEPFSFTWDNVPTGHYSLTARATDELFSTGTSASVNITVGNPPPQALLVVGAADDEPDISSRLESLGFVVEVIPAPDSARSDADGKALIVTSSTSSSGDIGDKFTPVAVPVINWEQALQDDLLYTGDVDGTDRATLGDQTEIDIVNPDHAMAAGLNGTVTVYSSPQTVSWGNAGANSDNAIQIATVAGNPDQWAIYGYETGATLVDGSTAAARRVHFFLENDTAAALSDDGWLLFDAAVDWAVDGLPDTDPDQPVLNITRSNGSVNVEWTGAGTLQTAESVTGPWTDVSGASSPHAVDLSGAEAEAYFRVQAE